MAHTNFRIYLKIKRTHFIVVVQARDVRNLTLRPETVTNVPLYVGFELRNRNQHAKMVVFDTEIEINILIVKSSKSKSKPKCLLMPCSK